MTISYIQKVIAEIINLIEVFLKVMTIIATKRILNMRNMKMTKMIMKRKTKKMKLMNHLFKEREISAKLIELERKIEQKLEKVMVLLMEIDHLIIVQKIIALI